MSKNIPLSKELFVAMNYLCTGSETKLLLALLGYDAEAMTTSSMMKITNITQPNNYFVIRKSLIDKGYIDADTLSVNVDKILSDYTNLPS